MLVRCSWVLPPLPSPFNTHTYAQDKIKKQKNAFRLGPTNSSLHRCCALRLSRVRGETDSGFDAQRERETERERRRKT